MADNDVAKADITPADDAKRATLSEQFDLIFNPKKGLMLAVFLFVNACLLVVTADGSLFGWVVIEILLVLGFWHLYDKYWSGPAKGKTIVTLRAENTLLKEQLEKQSVNGSSSKKTAKAGTKRTKRAPKSKAQAAPAAPVPPAAPPAQPSARTRPPQKASTPPAPAKTAPSERDKLERRIETIKWILANKDTKRGVLTDDQRSEYEIELAYAENNLDNMSATI